MSITDNDRGWENAGLTPKTLKASQALAKTEDVLRNITSIETVRPIIQSIDERIAKAIDLGLFEIEAPFANLDARTIVLVKKHYTDHGYRFDTRQTGRNEFPVYMTWKPIEPPPPYEYYDR